MSVILINNVTIISGIPQGFVVGPILFNCFFNYFFYFIKKASAHNFADDNTLRPKYIQNLIALLETESNTSDGFREERVRKGWTPTAPPTPHPPSKF